MGCVCVCVRVCLCTCGGICVCEEQIGEQHLSPAGAHPGPDIILTWIWDSFLFAILPSLGSVISLISGRFLLPLSRESN